MRYNCKSACQLCEVCAVWASVMIYPIRGHTAVRRSRYSPSCLSHHAYTHTLPYTQYIYIYIYYQAKMFVASWLPGGDSTPLTYFLQFSAHGANRNSVGAFVNILVSCWTLFRLFAFTIRFRERLSRVFRMTALRHLFPQQLFTQS